LTSSLSPLMVVARWVSSASRSASAARPVSPDHDPWNRERPRGAERYRWARVCPAQPPTTPGTPLATTSKNGE
jgi:hypothetical protein